MDEVTYNKIKKLRLTAISGWIVAIIFGVLLVFNLDTDAPPTPTGDFSQMRGQAGGRGFMDASNFLDSSGQVDYDAIAEIKARMPSGDSSFFLERMQETLDQAVTSGEITSSQATAIYKALED